MSTANRSARMGLVLLALTSSGVLLLVFDIALGTLAGVLAFAATLTVLIALWGVPPLGKRREPRT